MWYVFMSITGWIVTETLQYVLWQAYFDVSPIGMLGKIRQQIWAQLHFPFHLALILLLQGSSILALTLDVTLELKHLADTLASVCTIGLPSDTAGIRLLWDTISEMEIDYARGAINEKNDIAQTFDDLTKGPLCSINGSQFYTLDSRRVDDLMGNVTAALFQSMDITPSEEETKGMDISILPHEQILRLYMKVLEFVYVYYLVFGAIAMIIFAAFAFLTDRHVRRRYTVIGITFRLVLAGFCAGLIAFTDPFYLAYSFMTSPTILYAFTFILLLGMSFFFFFFFLVVETFADLSYSAIVRSTFGLS